MRNSKKIIRYYNHDYLSKIMKLAQEYKLEKALNEYQIFINNYPNVLEGYIYCADAFIKSNLLDKAEDMLNKGKLIISSTTPNRVLGFFGNMTIKLLCCQKKYQEAYDLLLEHEQKFIIKDFNRVFLEKKLGILDKAAYLKEERYFIKQIVDYNEELALEHIKEEHIYCTGNNKFKEDFPVEEIYYKLRAILPLEDNFISSATSTFYIFKYNKVGILNNKLSDYLKVVTLSNSNDIITMYPFYNLEKFTHTELNPEKEETITLSRTRKSQIDKFNQKYNNFKKDN